MKRIKGFEWEDQPWFPSLVRQYMMDFLRFVLDAGNLYEPVTPVLIHGLQQTNSSTIVDLCSGAGGAVQSIQQNMKKAAGKTICFMVTDLYPNITAYQQLEKATNKTISYSAQPVNAANVPSSVKGFRTVFSGFHHFNESAAQQVLQNAVDAGEGIAVFDGSHRSIWFIIAILIFHPVAFVLFTPFIKPFSPTRLLFTYLLPIVPFCTIWDGIVSVLRLYTPDELLCLSKTLAKSNQYKWQSGIVKNSFGMPIAYLTGYPFIDADKGDQL